MFPVRCFSCNKCIAPLHEKYMNKLASGQTPEQALNELNIVRYCCRRMFLSHVDLEERLLKVKSDNKTTISTE